MPTALCADLWTQALDNLIIGPFHEANAQGCHTAKRMGNSMSL